MTANGVGFDRHLYVLPFDHRGSFETQMFGWEEPLTPEQTAKIADAKRVVYDGFRAAVREWLTTAAGVPGFIGFAVGRTDFWEPLAGWRTQRTTRESAVAEIACRYQAFVDIFEGARA